MGWGSGCRATRGGCAALGDGSRPASLPSLDLRVLTTALFGSARADHCPWRGPGLQTGPMRLCPCARALLRRKCSPARARPAAARRPRWRRRSCRRRRHSRPASQSQRTEVSAATGVLPARFLSADPVGVLRLPAAQRVRHQAPTTCRVSSAPPPRQDKRHCRLDVTLPSSPLLSSATSSPATSSPATSSHLAHRPPQADSALGGVALAGRPAALPGRIQLPARCRRRLRSGGAGLQGPGGGGQPPTGALRSAAGRNGGALAGAPWGWHGQGLGAHCARVGACGWVGGVGGVCAWVGWGGVAHSCCCWWWGLSQARPGRRR